MEGGTLGVKFKGKREEKDKRNFKGKREEKDKRREREREREMEREANRNRPDDIHSHINIHAMLYFKLILISHEYVHTLLKTSQIMLIPSRAFGSENGCEYLGEAVGSDPEKYSVDTRIRVGLGR